MKRSGFIILLMLFCLGLNGCQNKSEADQDIVSRSSKIQIGMSFDSFIIERWKRDRDVFVSTAMELGAEVNVQNASGDVNEQIRQIEYFIEKRVNVIVIICIDGEALKDVVKKAKAQGIYVIAYDRLIDQADVDLYISFDNAAVGRMMGEALIEQGISGGKVLMLGGSDTDNNVPLVENGFKNVMDEAGVTILDSIHAGGWRSDIAGNYVYEHIDVVMKADAIMCGNDDLASKVVHALAEKRLAGRILVVGQDADLEACQRIVEGTQLMTVYKPVEKLAQMAAEFAVLLAHGTDITADKYELSEINDGIYNVPSIVLEPISVNAENIDEVIIGSGFHLKEDVYLNVPGKISQ